MHTDQGFDVIIIGAGHNGLTAAAILAGKGKRVCVLEKNDSIGGMARTYSPKEGLTAPRFAHLSQNLNPVVLRELGLSDRLNLKSIPTIALARDGRHVEIKNLRALYTNGTPHIDGPAFAKICTKLRKFADLLAPIALKSPPDISDGLSLASAGEVTALAKLGLDLKRMGKKDMREFMRIILSNVYDFVLDEISDGVLAGHLAADAVWGAWAGPRSPGTVLSLMYRYGVGSDASLPIGGMGSIIEAIADVARGNGAGIRTGSWVESIIVEEDCVKGVVLDGGEQVTAPVVLSSVGPLNSMKIAGVEHFDIESVRRLRNMRAKGTTAKLNLVLRDVPEIEGLTREQMASRLVIAPSALYVERAFNAVKYNRMADSPVLEAVIPDLVDPSLHSGDAHVLSVNIQYIPYHLEGGWNDAARRQLTETALNTLSEYMPNLRDLIVDADTFSPMDIEQETGAPGGHWHHGELSTDQLFTVRPVNGMSRYAFGMKGYYLCGAGAHPGGDVSGVPGRNSALQLLKDGVLS